MVACLPFPSICRLRGFWCALLGVAASSGGVWELRLSGSVRWEGPISVGAAAISLPTLYCVGRLKTKPCMSAAVTLVAVGSLTVLVVPL